MEDAKYQALVAEMQQMRNDFVSQMTELRAEVAQLKGQVAGKEADQGTHERNSHNGPDGPFVTHAASIRVVAASRIHEKKPFDWDLFIRAWLPRIFIFVLLLGVVFGFVAAVKAGYLTEPIRCVIGYVAGIAFIVLGELQISSKRAGLGQVLIGGGISILILSTFAANLLYGLLPSTPAFLLDLLFIVAGVYFSLRHKSQALAVVAAAGSFLVPFLVRSSEPNVWFFVGYELVCSTTFLYYSVRKNYRVLYYEALVLLHAAFVATLIVSRRPILEPRNSVLAGGLILQHVALLYTYLFLEPESKRAQLTLFSSFALTLLWWDGLLNLTSSFKWLLLCFLIVYLLLAAWQRKHTVRLVLTGSIASFALSLYLNQVLNGANKASALLLEGTLTALLGLYLKNKFQLIVGAIIYVVALVLVLTHPLQTLSSGYTVAWILGLVTLPAIRKYMFLSTYQLILFWLEAVLLLTFVTEVTNVLTQHRSVDLQHLSVSFAWIAYAALLVAYGILRNLRIARLAGVFLLFLTLAKLIVIDIPSVSVFIRAVLFIGLGGVGILVSRLFYRRGKEES